MADDGKFTCEVLTPEGEVFSGEVGMVSTRTKTGSLGILRGHAPLMGMLEPAELRLYENKDDGLNHNASNATRFAQAEGYIQMADNRCLVLVEDAITPENLDRSSLESKLKDSEQAAEQAEEDSEEKRRHERDAVRYRAFLEVAGSSE